MRDDPTEFMLRKRELEQAVPGLSQAVGSWLGAEGQNLPCALVGIPDQRVLAVSCISAELDFVRVLEQRGRL